MLLARVRTWLVFSLLIHLLTAYFSAGFYDMDEQFQILEFVSYRLKHTPAKDLPWEFHEKCRPWIQPLIYEAIIRVDQKLGFTHSDTWAMHLRIVSSLLGWLALCGLAICCSIWFPSAYWRRWAIRGLCIFWMIPYLHARTSSENFSSSAFFLGLALWTWSTNQNKKNIFYILFSGLLLGLSFQIRYQLIAAVGAFALWIFLFQKLEFKLKKISVLFLGFLLSIPIALVADRLGYGEWVVSSWRYLYDHIFLGRANQFGTLPFHYYFHHFIREIPPLGALLLGGTLLGWILSFRNSISFVTAVFFVIHCFVSHKEPRFLYPIFMAMPLVMTLGAEKLYIQYENFFKKSQLFWKAFAYSIWISSIGAMGMTAIKPARSIVNLYSTIERSSDLNNLYFFGENPFRIGGNEIHFYRKPALALHSLIRPEELLSQIHAQNEIWFVHSHFNLNAAEFSQIKNFCDLKYTVFPDLFKSWVKVFPGLEYANKTSLYRCHKINSAI